MTKLILLVGLVFLYSCNTKLEELPCERLRFDGDKTQGYIGRDVIIRDSIDFIKYSKIFYEQCDSLILPKVDFNKYSIIGKTFTPAIGYRNEINIRLFKKGTNLYIYEITVNHAGFSKMRTLLWSYSIVPKLSRKDSVEIKVKFSRTWLYWD